LISSSAELEWDSPARKIWEYDRIDQNESANRVQYAFWSLEHYGPPPDFVNKNYR